MPTAVTLLRAPTGKTYAWDVLDVVGFSAGTVERLRPVADVLDTEGLAGWGYRWVVCRYDREGEEN